MMDDQRREKKEGKKCVCIHLHEQAGWFRESEGRKSVRPVLMEEMEKLRSDPDGQDQNENFSWTLEEQKPELPVIRG